MTIFKKINISKLRVKISLVIISLDSQAHILGSNPAANTLRFFSPLEHLVSERLVMVSVVRNERKQSWDRSNLDVDY